MKRDLVLEIVGITKHQYYYQRKGGKQGRRPSTTTKMYMEEDFLVDIPNENVVDDIKDIAKVLPTEPLQVLEMDIKFVWVEEHRRHAYILTVIDTFSRVLLGRKTAYAIKQQTSHRCISGRNGAWET